MKPIPDGYEPTDEYKTYPEGWHTTRPNGDNVTLTWFTTNEETDEPILVGQPDGKLVGRCRLNVDEEGGPPMSLTMGEMALLVKAFGANVNELPKQPEINDAGGISQYMTKVSELINHAEKRVQIQVSDKGWINRVKGMELPKTTLNWVLTAVSRKDETGTPIKKALEFGEVFWPTLRVVSGPGGLPSPYVGVEIQPLVNYAIDQKNNNIDWQRNKGGSYTAAATRLNKLIMYTAPTMFQVDDFRPNHPENLLIDWQSNLPEKPHVISFNVDYNAKGYAEIIWATISPAGYQHDKEIVYNGKTEEKKSETKSEVKTVVINSPLNSIIELVKYLANTNDVTRPDGSLNDAGLGVAKIYFSPLRQSNALTHSRFVDYGLDEAKVIFEYVMSQKDDAKIKEMFNQLNGSQQEFSATTDECPF